MVSPNLAPLPIQRFVDSNGNALVGGKLFTYAAGTTTKLATYTDSGGLTQQTNPIILNARGEPENNLGNSIGIWLGPSAYKFVLSPSTDTDPPTNPIWTLDNIEPSLLSLIPNDTVLGNVSGGTAIAVPLTQTQLTTLINAFTSSLSGAAPASGGGTTNYLRADGTWAAPPGSFPAVPTADLLGGSAGAFTSVTVGTDLTLTGGVLSANPSVGGTQFYSAAGTYTFTVPAVALRVKLWGGGGGSGGTSGTAVSSGAGGGGFAESAITGLTVGSTVTVTVGGGGTAGANSPTNGGTGGTTSFGASVVATGGTGSGGTTGSVSTANGTGGTGTAGTVQLTAQPGGTPITIGAGSYISGAGGSSPFGGGTSQFASSGGPPEIGIAGVSPGGGAGGAVNGGAGAAGADGAVIIEW